MRNGWKNKHCSTRKREIVEALESEKRSAIMQHSPGRQNRSSEVKEQGGELFNLKRNFLYKIIMGV